MNDALRELSNAKNQVEAMKLKVLDRDDRIKSLERRVEELERKSDS